MDTLLDNNRPGSPYEPVLRRSACPRRFCVERIKHWVHGVMNEDTDTDRRRRMALYEVPAGARRTAGLELRHAAGRLPLHAGAWPDRLRPRRTPPRLRANTRDSLSTAGPRRAWGAATSTPGMGALSKDCPTVDKPWGTLVRAKGASRFSSALDISNHRRANGSIIWKKKIFFRSPEWAPSSQAPYRRVAAWHDSAYSK